MITWTVINESWQLTTGITSRTSFESRSGSYSSSSIATLSVSVSVIYSSLSENESVSGSNSYSKGVTEYTSVNQDATILYTSFESSYATSYSYSSSYFFTQTDKQAITKTFSTSSSNSFQTTSSTTSGTTFVSSSTIPRTSAVSTATTTQTTVGEERLITYTSETIEGYELTSVSSWDYTTIITNGSSQETTTEIVGFDVTSIESTNYYPIYSYQTFIEIQSVMDGGTKSQRGGYNTIIEANTIYASNADIILSIQNPATSGDSNSVASQYAQTGTRFTAKLSQQFTQLPVGNSSSAVTTLTESGITNTFTYQDFGITRSISNVVFPSRTLLIGGTTTTYPITSWGISYTLLSQQYSTSTYQVTATVPVSTTRIAQRGILTSTSFTSNSTYNTSFSGINGILRSTYSVEGVSVTSSAEVRSGNTTVANNANVRLRAVNWPNKSKFGSISYTAPRETTITIQTGTPPATVTTTSSVVTTQTIFPFSPIGNFGGGPFLPNITAIEYADRAVFRDRMNGSTKYLNGNATVRTAGSFPVSMFQGISNLIAPIGSSGNGIIYWNELRNQTARP